MSIGSSGRIVIEVDTDTKQMLYSLLKKDGMSLKEWFLKNVDEYLGVQEQLQLEMDRLTDEGGVK
ncbi:hypothetical protein [Aestuariirhabdus litorea]|uniref:Uncharacterized protein n=1 Tax=Aestuariirhabdus litorea TaxID=2528527 RepID=A0A3P3VPX7_9GAMM|nr:hypothetical protein [Aestuariirhabdus litorea]RRJ84377.1 hypothetical protein D0544_04520 [Aestuariirhabdus litorea]RWW97601.1 hypothetical protein DZC74_04515 [Endozoicomonadaceae bacterium GTF-13]